RERSRASCCARAIASSGVKLSEGYLTWASNLPSGTLSVSKTRNAGPSPVERASLSAAGGKPDMLPAPKRSIEHHPRVNHSNSSLALVPQPALVISCLGRLRDRNHRMNEAIEPTSRETSNDHTREATANRSALLIIFLVVFIDLFGFGIVLPLLPRYGKEFLTLEANASATSLERSLALHKDVVLGLLLSSFSLMQFFFAPIWGRIS